MRTIAPFMAVGLVALVGCGDDGAVTPPEDAGSVDAGADAGPPTDWPAMYVPASTVLRAGVRRDVFRVAGVTPAANPATSEATPSELDYTQVLRYRQDLDPPAPARAIVIAMPGFLGGGGTFEGLARALVLRGAAGDFATEVWAIDRRSNLLEDLRGMDTAEAAGNPEIAQGYYFGRETIDGETFPGYLAQEEVSYMSEWGLETHAEDLRRVIALVPPADRQGHVFLLGHSLGAAFTELYGAWRFEDGTRGVEELAGLILVDGILGGAPLTATEYEEGTTGGTFNVPGLTAIREGTRYTALPLLGIDVYARAEVLSLRALVAPEAVVVDRARDSTAALLLGLTIAQMPSFTNRAAIAVAFDDELAPLAFTRARLGHLAGGPVEEYANALSGETLVHPTDPDATYDWVDALDADPAEYTPVRNLAESFVHGRSNFAEWYFPTRLSLDIAACGGASVPEDDYQAAAGLRAFDGALTDAPVLCIAAGLVGDTASCNVVRDRVATEVGAGRPQEGALRTDASGFAVADVTDMAHLDPVLADDDTPGNPVPGAIEDFVRANVVAGAVAIDAM